MNNTLRQMARHQHIVMLQGPVGPFFSHLAGQLRLKGCQVHKINFNAGDALFYRDASASSYRDTQKNWLSYFSRYVATHQIQAIVLFGEWRKMHQDAIQLAKQHNIAVYVFEEGYIRPDYITLEPLGVNANSHLPRCAKHYQSCTITEQDHPKPVQHRFWRVAGYAVAYYAVTQLFRWYYPHYQHHRSMNLLTESIAWVKSGWRKWHYKHVESGALTQLYADNMRKQFFLVALQVHNDSQVLYHSDYNTIEEMIASTVQSFAHHAPNHITLVIKHHPMDRGYKDYSTLITQLCDHYQLNERLIYIHDGHLPLLLKQAKGVVTINSTVGLSALYHHTPVKVLGEAIYNIAGLVSSNTLDKFWDADEVVDEMLYANFRYELIERTQFNAGFYTPTSYPFLFAMLQEASSQS